MRIYLASSWRNKYYESALSILRAVGHNVYDFKHPKEGQQGFAWSDIDPNWQQWTPQQFSKGLCHSIAAWGFKNDFDAMKSADACVLLLPCGRSAHLEGGWMKGAGKKLFILVPEKQEPELMYRMSDGVVDTMSDILVLCDPSLTYNKAMELAVTWDRSPQQTV